MGESVSNAPFGTVVGWRTPGGHDFGVVVGSEKDDLLCLVIYDKAFIKEPSVKHYKDEELTDKLAKTTVLPGLLMDVHRVPKTKAFKRDRMIGTALRPYLIAAVGLQLEGVMFQEMSSVLDRIRATLSEAKWIQKAVKKPGRLPKILGVKQDEYDEMSKEQKLKAIDAKLKELEGDSGEKAKSMRGALILGKRFIGGSIGKKKAAGEEECKED